MRERMTSAPRQESPAPIRAPIPPGSAWPGVAGSARKKMPAMRESRSASAKQTPAATPNCSPSFVLASGRLRTNRPTAAPGGGGSCHFSDGAEGGISGEEREWRFDNREGCSTNSPQPQILCDPGKRHRRDLRSQREGVGSGMNDEQVPEAEILERGRH